MAVIDLGNGNVLKDGVFFGNTPTYRTRYIYDKETGKQIGSEMKHCEKPYYPQMTEADHVEEEQLELAQEIAGEETAKEINTEDLMEHFKEMDRLEEIK
tara:strand:+ start:186 stop:482 length:297 start_codon:yes stop_codon:yes gene_type:complete